MTGIWCTIFYDDEDEEEDLKLSRQCFFLGVFFWGGIYVLYFPACPTELYLRC